MKARMYHRNSPNLIRSTTMFPAFQSLLMTFHGDLWGPRTPTPIPDPGDPDGDLRFAVLALLQIYLSSTYLSLYFCGSDPGHVTLHLALTSEA